MIDLSDNNKPLRAILAGLQLSSAKQANEEHFDRSMQELHELAKACNVEVAGVITQTLPAPVQATYVGAGKVEEIKAAMYMFDATLVIFDQSLSPTQIRNLARLFDGEVIDRTELILRIFSNRARTREARLQVEYARLEYMLPRLVGLRDNLSRQGGNAGFRSSRGAGETKLELDRRKIVARQAALRRELREIEQERKTQSIRRRQTDALSVSLVGYTNAGKSTLMNQLLSMSAARGHKDKEVFVRDMLFATLDTTTRRIGIYPHRPFLLSDTVGFIDDLPTSLIKAFRSTLAEAAAADLLLLVIDATDPFYKAQIEVTLKTLAEIGAGHIPLIRVYNKTDLLPRESVVYESGVTVHGEQEQVRISARTGAGMESLLQLLDARVKSGQREDEKSCRCNSIPR